MDAELVGEGVLADDRLVVLDREGGDRRDQLRGAHQQRRVDIGVVGQHVAAGLDRHDDLFERRIARPLAEAVDGAFDLAGAADHAGERVGDRHAEIVMAMGREDHRAGIGHPLDQHADQGAELLRRGVADRVGDVDGRGPRLDRRLDHPAEEIVLGAGGVHRRPLDVVGVVARPRHRRDHPLMHLLLVELELELPVERRGADEGVDALPLGMDERFGGAVDVAGGGPGQPADHRPLDPLGDFRDRFEVAVGGDRKAGFDDVDAHLVEELGDLDLLLERHRCAGRLLAVAERRVEDDDAILVLLGFGLGGHDNDPSRNSRPLSVACGQASGVSAFRPLSARPRNGRRRSGASKEEDQANKERLAGNHVSRGVGAHMIASDHRGSFGSGGDEGPGHPTVLSRFTAVRQAESASLAPRAAPATQALPLGQGNTQGVIRPLAPCGRGLPALASQGAERPRRLRRKGEGYPAWR